MVSHRVAGLLAVSFIACRTDQIGYENDPIRSEP